MLVSLGVLMNKFSVDYTHLATSLHRKVYALDDVKDRIEKIAFDVVRFMDGSEDIDKLWKIHQDNDGKNYIVAMYDDEEEATKTAKTAGSNEWDASIDKRATTIQIFYKNEPIKKIAIANYGWSAPEAAEFATKLPQKLSEDRKFAHTILASLDDGERETLLAKYPELRGV